MLEKARERMDSLGLAVPGTMSQLIYSLPCSGTKHTVIYIPFDNQAPDTKRCIDQRATAGHILTPPAQRTKQGPGLPVAEGQATGGRLRLGNKAVVQICYFTTQVQAVINPRSFESKISNKVTHFRKGCPNDPEWAVYERVSGWLFGCDGG